MIRVGSRVSNNKEKKMPKRLTPEEKAARDARIREQAEKNKGKKRLKFLMAVVKDKDDPAILRVVIPDSEGLTNSHAVAGFMEKMNMVGTVYPMRLNDPVTRYEQKVMRTIIGEPKIKEG